MAEPRKNKFSKYDEYKEVLHKVMEWRKNDPEKYGMAVFGLTHERQSDSLKRMLSICPAGSVLEGIALAFEKNTNIPLELPVFSFISSAMAMLARRKITVSHDRVGTLYTDTWHCILAPSGAAKTFSLNMIQDKAPADAKPNMTTPSGGAAFMQMFSEVEGNGYWVEDEWGQLLRQIDPPSGAITPLVDVKSMMLKSYGNKAITRTKSGRKKAETIEIENPILTFYGINTIDSFIEKSMSLDSMFDGYSQRFLYGVAQKDESKSVGDYAIYDLKILQQAVEKAWEHMENTTIHPHYTISDSALEKYSEYFNSMWGTSKVNESFYRRIMWTSFKYAILMHILMGDESDVITRFDVAMACRICSLHLDDTAFIIQEKMGGGEKMRSQIKSIVERGLSDHRSVQRGFSGVDLTAEEARTLLDIAETVKARRLSPSEKPEIVSVNDEIFNQRKK